MKFKILIYLGLEYNIDSNIPENKLYLNKINFIICQTR